MSEKIKYLSQKEREKLFRCIDESDAKYILRDRAIIKLAYYCALRVSEIRDLKLSDFNKQTREITCNRKQNGISNVLKIEDEKIYKDVCKYYDLRMNDNCHSEYFFVSQQGKSLSSVSLHKIAHNYCEMAGIEKEKGNFQIFRYTRAMDLIDMGCDLNYLMWYVGLSSVASTKVFALFLVKQYSLRLSQKDNKHYEAYNTLERGKDAKSKSEEPEEIKFDD